MTGCETPIVHTVAKPALPTAGAEPVASPRFAHDPNYHWLVGTIAYSKVQDAWVLRYAAIEDGDRYGGSVTLVGLVGKTGLQSGQQVRVEGHLIDPNSQQIRPAFEARSIRPVER